MSKVLSAKLGLVKTGLVLASMSIAVTGCSTSNVTKVTQGAPITYKLGQGDAQYASAPTISQRSNRFSPPSARSPIASAPAVPYQPQQITPQAVPQAFPAPAPQPVQLGYNAFDQSSIDTDLYKHQRVGKRYTILGKSYTPKHEPDYNVVGTASWYGDKFHGKPTATGETFNKNDLTAAHKTLPLNSILHVTNLENGKTLMVRLNDRGPFIGDRIIDLSEASAQALGITSHGLGKVRVQYAGPADPMASQRSAQAIAPQPVPYPEDSYVEAPQAYTPAPSAPPAPYIPAQPAPRVEPVIPAPIAPRAPQAVRPQEPEGDGEVTLTIKGPIHVAGYDDEAAKPRLIRERLKTK